MIYQEDNFQRLLSNLKSYIAAREKWRQDIINLKGITRVFGTPPPARPAEPITQNYNLPGHRVSDALMREGQDALLLHQRELIPPEYIIRLYTELALSADPQWGPRPDAPRDLNLSLPNETVDALMGLRQQFQQALRIFDRIQLYDLEGQPTSSQQEMALHSIIYFFGNVSEAQINMAYVGQPDNYQEACRYASSQPEEGFKPNAFVFNGDNWQYMGKVIKNLGHLAPPETFQTLAQMEILRPFSTIGDDKVHDVARQIVRRLTPDQLIAAKSRLFQNVIEIMAQENDPKEIDTNPRLSANIRLLASMSPFPPVWIYGTERYEADFLSQYRPDMIASDAHVQLLSEQERELCRIAEINPNLLETKAFGDLHTVINTELNDRTGSLRRFEEIEAARAPSPPSIDSEPLLIAASSIADPPPTSEVITASRGRGRRWDFRNLFKHRS